MTSPSDEARNLPARSRAMLLNLLWHHQGGHSPVGQPIRAMLGIAPDAHLTDDQLAEAKRVEAALADPPVDDAMVERGMDGAWTFAKAHADYVGPDDADWRTVMGDEQEEVENLRGIVKAVLVAALAPDPA